MGYYLHTQILMVLNFVNLCKFTKSQKRKISLFLTSLYSRAEKSQCAWAAKCCKFALSLRLSICNKWCGFFPFRCQRLFRSYSQSEIPSGGRRKFFGKTGENIYKRKDGRWEGRFISARKPDGKAKYASVYARTYTEVKAKLEERKRTFVKRPVESCRLTVKELFAWYLAQVDVKPSTRARYSFLIEKHILPFMGMLPVTALTAKCLTDFLNQKQKTGRLSGGSLSAKSVRDIGVLLKGALRFAAREFQFYCDALNVPLPAAKSRASNHFLRGSLHRSEKLFYRQPITRTQGFFFRQTEDCGLARSVRSAFRTLTSRTARFGSNVRHSVSGKMETRA